MRYISRYEEYPIYEPAEGGYYYSGNQLVESERLSKRACKKELLRIWEECKKENEEMGFREDNFEEWDHITSRTRMTPWVFNEKFNIISRHGYYIGEGESFVIERNQGASESGRVSYC